jgi:hypothetical protein
VIPTGLCQVAARSNAELDAQVLKQNRHQIRDHNDRQERVTEPCAAGQVGCPITRIHVADRDEKTGPREREEFPPK